MSDNYLEVLIKELQKNGVSLKKLPFNPDKFTVDELETEAIKTESFNFLDFSEHDKGFKDEIDELKAECMEHSVLLGKCQKENKILMRYIAELESIEPESFPFDPLEAAKYIINLTYERESNRFERGLGCKDTITEKKYDVDDLEQIAEHLLIYCKHSKETE